MSSLSSLFAYETMPSLLLVVGIGSLVTGLFSDQICAATDDGCKSNLSNVKNVGIASMVSAAVLGLLAFLGVISFGGGYGFGGMGGGYGGGYGGMW